MEVFGLELETVVLLGTPEYMYVHTVRYILFTGGTGGTIFQQFSESNGRLRGTGI